MPFRPRRSVLYMPGANARALEKAKSLDADCLILNLEDSVAPDKKVEARDRVAAAIATGAMASGRSSSASMVFSRRGARKI